MQRKINISYRGCRREAPEKYTSQGISARSAEKFFYAYRGYRREAPKIFFARTRNERGLRREAPKIFFEVFLGDICLKFWGILHPLYIPFRDIPLYKRGM